MPFLLDVLKKRMDNYYTLFGCNSSASYEELKKKYQELVLKHHPDKVNSPTSEVNAESKFIQLTEAWQVLRDVEKRKAYDAQLLAEQCLSEKLIYATVTWSELDCENENCTYLCRCGSVYSVPQALRSEGSECHVPCSECSFGLVIKAETV